MPGALVTPKGDLLCQMIGDAGLITMILPVLTLSLTENIVEL